MKITTSTVALIVLVAQCMECRTIDEILAAAQNTQSEDGTPSDHPGASDTVTVEMDMVFTKEAWAEMQAGPSNSEIVEQNSGSRDRNKRKAKRDLASRWPNAIVPYEIGHGFSSSYRQVILAAINEWEEATCLNFRQKRRRDQNYIAFQTASGCSSYVGMKGGAQPIKLAPGCEQKSIVIHELGHAIGLYHEQSRPDRDTYVTINSDNIRDGKEHNFLTYSTQVINTYDVPYDYLSIMHYGQNYFSKNGQPTITTEDPRYQTRIGNAKELSERDVQVVKAMYGCVGQCTVFID